MLLYAEERHIAISGYPEGTAQEGCDPDLAQVFSLGLNDEDWPEAYVCRECKQIVIPYEEG